ncbi:MAG: transcription termination factor Rho [Eubacteriales bacterium]|nr:transcription termination factor Rho [Eubacteriales bacterium]
MPESKLNGKAKADLATIAVVSGLLPADQAAKMTKPELLNFLKTAENATVQPQAPTAKVKAPTAKAKAPTVKAKAPAVAILEPAVTAQEPAPTPQEVAKKPAPRKPAAKRTSIAPITEPVATAEPVSLKAEASDVPAKAVSPSEVPAKAVSQAELPEKPIQKPTHKPVNRPIERQADRPARNHPQHATTDRTGYVKKSVQGKPPVRTNNRTQGNVSARSQDRPQGQAPNARNPRNTTASRVKQQGVGRGQSQQPSRPMRVKMFGIPINPMAAQSDEHEQAMQLDRDALLLAGVSTIESTDYSQENSSEREPEFTTDTTGQGYDDAENNLISPEIQDGEDFGSDKAARKAYIESGEAITGVLEIMPDGYGFLRRENYIQGAHDAYVPPQYIRRFNLRPGDLITGPCKKQRDNDRYQALLYIKEVNGELPEKMLKRPHFDRLTPIYPDERYVLETTRNELSTRIIDLVSPIGKGQRGMIVSPPKAGKTILLQKVANAISTNNPNVKLIVLLIDERPEEVTDMQRSINGEVVFSTFDKTPENHVKITELVLERAMRLVELKQDVVILLDSMTRLGRAYNLTITPTGRTLSGGLDPGALYGPKRFFGAARNIENGGSLTIIATSLIETGSRMDEVIFEEFKGTGNMEVLLDRKLSEKRIFPAIDINKSGTRREELLLTSKELDAVWTIRKAFGQLDTAAVTETIINLLLKTTNNQQFISSINVSFNDKNVFEAMRGTRPQSNQNSNQNGNGN